ncbi:MAG: TolC family protein, partial [Acidobacteriota bacterium]
VVTEPLTQAQRDVVYAIYGFERYKRTFSVRIASDYLSVLQQLDQVENARENYRSLVASTRRAVRLAEAGRLPEIQVDQARQNELRARDRWVGSRESYRRRLDTFKISLGLPPDAAIELDQSELERLSEVSDRLSASTIQPDEDEAPPADAPIVLVEPDRRGAGPLEMEERDAIILALDRRLDLRVEVGRVYDSQRGVVIAADQLRADLTLLGSGSIGAGRSLSSVSLDDAEVRTDEASYSTLLNLDLGLERTAERNAYRNSLIDLERAVRDVQALEDEIKLEIRNGLSGLLESRESTAIQVESVAVAQRRVESTNLFLEAGRAEIRDLLEAQEALVSAQNALTAALVSYRVGELELQRDLGVLEVNERGLWQEYVP